MDIKGRQVFISGLSTGSLCNNHVDWVNVSVEPKHLDDRNGDEDSASYCRKAFQTMDWVTIYHDSQMARNHLERLQKNPIYSYGEVDQSMKSTQFCELWTPAVYPEPVISGILHLQLGVLLQSPEYDHLETDITFGIRDWDNENPVGPVTLQGLTVGPKNA